MRTAATALIVVTVIGSVEWRAHAADSDRHVTFSALSANVAAPGSTVRIQILRWSTDEQRDRLAAALVAPARASGPPPATAPDNPPTAARGAGGAGPAGRGGRAGLGRARGDSRDSPAVPLTPIQRLAAAMTAQPTSGFIWTNEVTGYAIKYAYRVTQADGGQRIILATDRRLGAYTDGWRPVDSGPNPDYDFTVVELRLDATGAGDATASLTTPVTVDADTKSIALEKGASSPVILRNVKRQQSGT